MNKSAAVRSQARRATLTKAALAPAQVLGYAGMLGGGALASDAAMNGEQSATKRIGKGVLSAGLAYTGHKAMTDPKWQGAINNGAQKAVSYIRSLLGGAKAAEARTEKRALDNVGSEIGGTIAAPLVGGAGGAGLGALVGAALAAAKGKPIGRGAGRGAAAGLAIGAPAAHVANIGGILAGVIRKRRTKQEQQEHDRKSHWGNLIPGVGSYNYTKRMGRVLSGVGEPDEQKKAAEARDAAYVEGFCKAAEAMGVDPVALYKQAAPWAAIGRLVGKGLGAARSLGGSAARLSQAAGAAAARTRAGQAVMGAGQRYLGLLRGGNVAQLQSKAQNLRSLAGRYNLDAMTAPSPELVARAQGVAGRAMRQAGRAEGMLAREQRAVDLARVGTAGGLGAAGLLALRGGKSGGQPQGQAGAVPTSASEMARQGWLNA